MNNKLFNIFIVSFIAIVAILVGNSLLTPKDGKLTEVEYKQVLKMVEEKNDFVLLVSQSTCSHCATYKPKLKTIAKDYGLEIFYIDYDKEDKDTQKKFLDEFHLSGATPTTMFFENGKEKSLLNRIEGDLSSTKVLEKLKKMGFID